ncbi:MAG TPA: phosphodiester glycosidase family protein [Candidatus Monoglobus merdigallinarum]|uniref:Phosphodiester glycosidase family protein n=1 Tax=Candidatus Monoglobus merdigallinarum TaxID=2838698 RepID=A0A9D1TMF7_9FIRM|nr:phosphodiester glycosidase family protein [Candidatus Monoglobus merdigallinarum]
MQFDIFNKTAAAAILAAAMLIGSINAYAVESEYDYDFQIDVSAFSNASAGTISADTPAGTTAAITENGSKLYVNGHERYLSSPMIYADGTLMAALTSLPDFIQCSVYYDPSLYTAYVINSDYSIKIALGSNLAVINNTYTEEWSAPLINYYGTLYVPLESLMNSLWYTVDFTNYDCVNIVSHTPQDYQYSYIGGVHVCYIDPLNIKAEAIVNKSAESSGKSNYSNSTFFGWEATGNTYSVGIIVSDGQVISNYITHGSPVTTLIVHYDGSVEIKRVSNIYEEENVLFAVSGCGVLPTVTASEEGFVGTFDIDRYTNRTYIGYNPDMDKIVLCVSSSTTLARAGQVLSSLGCMSGLALDGGGSAALGLDNGVRFTSDGRKQYAVLYWE